MEPRLYCAYNQTRECFLGLKVVSADLLPAELAERMKSLVLGSGEGFWIKPFRGLYITELQAPLDLIYLGEDGQVLEAVESFPTFRATPACPRAASVLALPAHSLYSSQTQTGDRVAVCVAEEMEQRLKRTGGKPGSPVQSAVLLREQPLWSGGNGVLALETPAERAAAGELHEIELARPEAKPVWAQKNWFQRWWSPDPRKAPREPAPGLAAYYWDGAAPAAHGIRDISSSGLYLITEDRWYPGTLVLMTLQHADAGEEIEEKSIAVLTRAVRWGKDGVGLQFMLQDDKNAPANNSQYFEGASRKEFDRFLQQLKKGR